MAYETIRYELTDGIATITLNRPNVHNAMNERMREELTGCFGELAQSPEARVIVVSGAGERAFSAGADIREFVAPQVPVRFRDARRRVDFRAAMDRCGQPIIAAIRGFALGGGLELALACDLRYAAEDAKLGQPEIRLGVMPGAGGTQRLTRLVGPGKARDLVYTGRQAGAAEALAMGLVEHVFSPDDVFDRALRDARAFARGPREALESAKRAIRSALGPPLEDGLREEREAFIRLFGTPDQKEGMRAFLEKREPRFSGGPA